MNIYPPIEYPSHIKYVLNTTDNIIYLISICVKSNFSFINNGTYIQVDLKSNTFYISPDYNWLYCDPPPLIEVDEINKLLRINKINKILLCIKQKNYV